jgi:rhamnosyltransferase
MGQFDVVAVVDDGSGSLASDLLLDLARLGAWVVALRLNSGIAKALNLGVEMLSLSEEDLIFTFDQDSQPPVGYRRMLMDVWHDVHALDTAVGCVVPQYFSGESQASPGSIGGLRLAYAPIQSGASYRVRAMRTAGPFAEDYFIDLVDVEYALRLHRCGYVTVVAPGLDLPHRLGETRSARILGRTIKVTVSTPFRYYYRARNRVLLNHSYGEIERAFLRGETRRDLRDLLSVLLIAKGRAALLKVVIFGIADGLRARYGRIPSGVERVASRVRWRGSVVERDT